jgi:GMP synthase (glutamine-hydrolysing)
MARDPRVLVVQHQDDCPPALIGRWLLEAGCVVDIRRPYAGGLPLPLDLADHEGLVVLGGSMGADDDGSHPWLVSAKELVRVAAREGKPALGICLGHQLAAVALGGTVQVISAGRQFGVLPVAWTREAAGDALLGTRPGRAIHWNNDVVTELPRRSVVLARAPDGTVQAARFADSVWGIQAHPEVDEGIVARWAADERDEIGPELVDQRLEEMVAAGPDLEAAWRPVATAFAELLHGVTRSHADGGRQAGSPGPAGRRRRA